MTDPLHVLRTPLTPVDPDPAFATHLRARLERALALPQGVAMSETITTVPADEPAYRHDDVGYAWLSVPDVERAVAFYGAVLGWRVAPGSDPQGRYVLDRAPHLGLHEGEAGSTLNCCYAVEDVQRAAEQVRAAGGRVGEPQSAPYGLVADCVDDQGTVFALYQPPTGVGTQPAAAAGAGEGDLVYVTYEVVNSARARAFYGQLLGWAFTAGGVEDGWQVVGGSGGLEGGHRQTTTLPMWRVSDLPAAVQRVRAAGGTATDPVTRPYGAESECTDDQGTRFYLGQLRSGSDTAGPAACMSPPATGQAAVGSSRAAGSRPRHCSETPFLLRSQVRARCPMATIAACSTTSPCRLLTFRPRRRSTCASSLRSTSKKPCASSAPTAW